MINFIKKSKKGICKNVKSKRKFGGKPIQAIHSTELGAYEQLDPTLARTGKEVIGATGVRIVNQSNFIIKESISDSFESLLSWNKTGLIALVGTTGLTTTLTISFIVAAALFVTLKFYFTLRNNSYAYRNALVVIYEFYETLSRLNNILEYIEEVSKSLDPPLKLDSAEIYQDIKYIFQVMDLITTSTMFKTININAAKGNRFLLPDETDETDEPLTIPKEPGLGARIKSKLKGWSFNENDWMNKMNAAIVRFNTHIIMLLSEWKIIADLRSPNVNQQILEERKKLKSLKCMIIRMILAPLIRVRNIMYACALSSQTDICLSNANMDEPVKFEISKFKENMKRLWNKIKDGGTADFKKILSILNLEIIEIKKNSDYISTEYIDPNVKQLIEDLHIYVTDILKSVNGIILEQYQSIFKNVELIYNYVQNCNLDSTLNNTIKNLYTNIRYNFASENTVQKMVIIGEAEISTAREIKTKYNTIHSLLIDHFKKVDIVIDIKKQYYTGVVLLDIPYNSHYIPQNIIKYYEYLKQIKVEYSNIDDKLMKLINEIKDDDTISDDIKDKINHAKDINREKLTYFLINESNLLVEIQEDARLNSIQNKSAKILQDIVDIQERIETYKTEIKMNIGKFIFVDYNNIQELLRNLLKLEINDTNITEGIIIDYSNITKEIEVINTIIENKTTELYDEEFIKELDNTKLIYIFIKSILEDNEKVRNFNVDQIVKSKENGNDLAKYLLFINLVNNRILYFKDPSLYSRIHDNIKLFFNDILRNYVDIDYNVEIERKKRHYINFLKGFLCSIHEVRVFKKIEQLIYFNTAISEQHSIGCRTLTPQYSSAFNSAVSASKYGGKRSRKNNKN